jgi:hypothetical protein
VDAFDSSGLMGYNAGFDKWASTYPDGWSNWSGAAPTKISAGLQGGVFAVGYTAAGASLGCTITRSWATQPMPLNTYISGNISFYLVSRTAGLPGVLVRLFTNSALSTYVDIRVQPNTTTGVWQRVPFIGAVGATQQIFGIQLYAMAAWSGFASGLFSGECYIDSIQFDFNEKITSGNISTLIADAAIGSAQIGSLALVGTNNFSVKSATAGARMEMDSRAIKVFDASGVLRVQLGDLTV